MSNKAHLTIDWDARTLRIVHAFIGRVTKIDQVLSVPFPSDLQRDDAEAMGGFIKQVLSKANIGTKRALVDIPRDQANFYTLKLPNAPIGELAGMVAFQIPKELPYAVDQAVVDFAVPRTPEDGLNDVLVAAVRNEVLDQYVRIFEYAGLKLVRVGLRPNANQFAVNELLKVTPHEQVLFVDVGPATTEISVIRNGQLVFSRAADVAIPASLDDAPSSAEMHVDGGDRPTDTGDLPTDSEDSGISIVRSLPSSSTLKSIVRELMIEVTRSIEAYRTGEPGFTMDHAVIGGSCDIEESLSEAIQSRYNVSAQPYNPATCFGWDADRGAAAGAFAAPLGLALTESADAGLRFDFLHPKKSVSRAQLQMKKAPIAIGCAVLAVLVLGGIYFNFVRPQYIERDRLLVEKRALKKLLKGQEEFKNLVEIVRRHEADHIVWIDELRDSLTLIPDSERIVLDSLSLSGKTRAIKFGFKAADSKTNHEVVKTLNDFRISGEESPRFHAVSGATSIAKDAKDGKPAKYTHQGSMTIRIEKRKPHLKTVDAVDAVAGRKSREAGKKTSVTGKNKSGSGGKAVSGRSGGSRKGSNSKRKGSVR